MPAKVDPTSLEVLRAPGWALTVAAEIREGVAARRREMADQNVSPVQEYVWRGVATLADQLTGRDDDKDGAS